MANLYEINAAIMSCVDSETGEIIDPVALDHLLLQRNEKLENVVLWIKNLRTDALAYKAEKESFESRQKAAEKKIEGLTQYLINALQGEKFQTTRCAVSFRKSPPSVQLDDEAIAIEWAEQNNRYDCIKYTAPTINKTELKKLIQSGAEVPGAMLVHGVSITIK